MAAILFDPPQIRINLLPFTFTRPIAEIRIGILTITEKWEKALGEKVSWLTEPYLQAKYPSDKSSQLYINGSFIPNQKLKKAISSLEMDESIIYENEIVAFRTEKPVSFESLKNMDFNFRKHVFEDEALSIDKPWKIFINNGNEIRSDIQYLQNQTSNNIPDPHTTVYNPENVFVEPGVKIRAAILNAENGPIYLGKNVEIKEGAMIRGPFAICEGSIVNMGAKMIGDNTIGPFCKVGGEMSNSVIFGHSNKSHDGFLGNSVIGEWCNFGADSNTSNLKNNYQKIKIWDYQTKSFVNTGLQFCGLLMGDHAKCGINTMFNTGTVAGVGASIFGEGYPKSFIPSFTWGGSVDFQTFIFDKFLEMTKVVMERRNKDMDEIETNILKHIYQITSEYRFWERP